MNDITSAADRFRNRLRERETAALAELNAAYDRLDAAVRAELDRLMIDLDAARAAGEQPRISWLYRQHRLNAVRAVIAVEAARFAARSVGPVGHWRAAATHTGVDDALALLGDSLPERALPALTPLNPVVVEQLVGQTAAGTPLRDLFTALGPDLEQRLVGELVNGVALGRSPIVIARRMTSILDGNRARALTIARTEALRAHREVSHLTYRANAEFVAGWIWWSSQDRTQCPVCWAMHGSWHTLEETLDEHPSGRCTPIPDVRPAPGMPTPPLPEAGPDAFTRMPDDVQRRALGPQKHDAYRAGAITLPDLVEQRRDPRWGTTRTEASLDRALSVHGRRTTATPIFNRGADRIPPPSRSHAIDKLRRYALHATHPRGRHKARVWQAALGYSSDHAAELADQLIAAAQAVTPTIKGYSAGWVRYRTVLHLTGRNGRTARVVASWQTDEPGGPLRLTTTYPEG